MTEENKTEDTKFDKRIDAVVEGVSNAVKDVAKGINHLTDDVADAVGDVIKGVKDAVGGKPAEHNDDVDPSTKMGK